MSLVPASPALVEAATASTASRSLIPATTESASPSARLWRSGCIHCDGPVLDRLPIETVYGCLALGHRRHLHKCKPSGAPTIAISWNTDRVYLPVGSKLLRELALRYVHGKVTDKNLHLTPFPFFLIISVPSASTPRGLGWPDPQEYTATYQTPSKSLAGGAGTFFKIIRTQQGI